MDAASIKTARVKMGLSVSEFAKHIGGFSCSTISRWEAGSKMGRRSFARIFNSFPIKDRIMMIERISKSSTHADLVKAEKELLRLLRTELKKGENPLKLAA